MKKSRIIKTVAILLGMFLLGAVALDLCTDTERSVFRFVVRHEAELTEIARDCLEKQNAVKKYGRMRIDGVYGGIVQFSAPLNLAAPYSGFYYAKDGIPAAFQGADVPLCRISDGTWTWEDGTGNSGVTKRITEYWFYYEAHF